MSENFLFQIENLSKIFGYGFLSRTKFPAVDNVSLNIENKPRIFTVAGESGCGKTTLARIMLRIIEPSSGTILYKGKNLQKFSSNDKLLFLKEVQGIFQDPFDTFNPLKKVETYLYETARNLLGLKNYEEASKHIDDILRFMGLSLKDVRSKYPHEFSGGELQRVSIARALISKPSLIIADEPVSMIDASTRMNILNIFKDLKNDDGISFIYITHDLATAYYISDDMAIMYRGTIVEIGPAEKVLTERYHPYTKALMDALPEYGKRSEWLNKKIKPSGIEIKEFVIPYCKYAHLCQFKMNICTQKRPPMFDVNGVKVSCWLYQ
jgi:peptide/nickel transport system ATP-binding protein